MAQTTTLRKKISRRFSALSADELDNLVKVYEIPNMDFEYDYRDILDIGASSLTQSEKLAMLFLWEESPQGQEYWEHVCNRLEELGN